MFLSNWIKWLADIKWQWPDWCKVCPLINTFQAGELSQLIHALITPQKKYVRSYPHLHWVSSHEIPMNLPTFVACRTGHCPHSRDNPHHDSGSRCIRRSKRTRRPLWMCIPGIARQVTSDLPLFSGGLEYVFIFPYIGNDNPNWLYNIFQGVDTTNQFLLNGRCLFVCGVTITYYNQYSNWGYLGIFHMTGLGC